MQVDLLLGQDKAGLIAACIVQSPLLQCHAAALFCLREAQVVCFRWLRGAQQP